MSEENQTLWERLFGGTSRDERKEKVLQYLIHRLKAGASLEDAMRDEYVHRNLSQSEIDEITSNPELANAAREQLEQVFESDEMRPKPPSE